MIISKTNLYILTTLSVLVMVMHCYIFFIDELILHSGLYLFLYFTLGIAQFIISITQPINKKLTNLILILLISISAVSFIIITIPFTIYEMTVGSLKNF
jgi:hypothetical protein